MTFCSRKFQGAPECLAQCPQVPVVASVSESLPNPPPIPLSAELTRILSPLLQQRSVMAWKSRMSSPCVQTAVTTPMPTAQPPPWALEVVAAVPSPSQNGVGVS